MCVRLDTSVAYSEIYGYIFDIKRDFIFNTCRRKT